MLLGMTATRNNGNKQNTTAAFSALSLQEQRDFRIEIYFEFLI